MKAARKIRSRGWSSSEYCSNGDDGDCADDRANQVYSRFYNLLKRNECDLVHVYQKDYGPDLRSDDIFDFIVIGAGTAGSVVANRLSELPDDKDILLIEAGGDPPYSNEIMYTSTINYSSAIDWNFETEYDGKTCVGYRNGRCGWLMGKVLGGSSVIGGMIYTRGRPYDYDYWANVTEDESWKFENVLPYFRKSEDFQSTETDPSALRYHGVGGYLTVGDFFTADKYYEERIEALHSGFRELGIPTVKDNSDATAPAGVTKLKGTVRKGKRCSIAKAFLLPIKDRTHLKVAKFTLATKLLIDKETRRAFGVQVRNKLGQILNLYSRNEIIVSAGTVNSAKLLMLSGIGPRYHLENLGIPLIKSAPVGYNLHDSINYHGFLVKLNTRTPFTELNYLDGIYDLLTRSSAVFSGIGLGSVDVYANVYDQQSPSSAYRPSTFLRPTDVRFNNTALMRQFVRVFRSEIVDSFIRAVQQSDVISFASAVCKVESKGRLLLRSTDPDDAPIIHPNYLNAHRDRETVLKAMELLTKFINTTAMKNMGAAVVRINVTDCADKPFMTPDYWNCTLNYVYSPTFHAVGSVKMGSMDDDSAVLDSRLRVKGIRNLRVIDASIMPEIVSGNTLAATVMIAEKAVDSVKRDYLQSLSGYY